MATWLLIHSPLVGPTTWGPVAAEMQSRGHDTIVPDLTPALAAPEDHLARQAELVTTIVRCGPVVLVAHSGAGPLLPAIAHRLAGQHVSVEASVFVDARLPHPGQSALDVLPTAAVEQLRQMTVEGWVPPWPSWWPIEQLDTMLPDEPPRRVLINTSPRLPASLFSQTLPDLGYNELGRCCYVRLSAAYDTVVDQAEQAGWPVRRLDAHHLAILTSPAEVADGITGVVTRWQASKTGIDGIAPQLKSS